LDNILQDIPRIYYDQSCSPGFIAETFVLIE
jgi:hypothetical protein